MSERLRVLVVPKWYPWPELPVFGLFCREHARALATRHDVVVLASLATPRPPFRAFELEDAVEDGIRTLRVRYRRPFLRPAAMGFQLLGMLAALRRLRSDGWWPDVVHGHVYQSGPPALILGRLAGAPVAITEHYTGFRRGLVRGYDRLLARLSFERADVVAPVSEYLAAGLRELAPKARMRVLPNTVDTGVFHPAGEGARPERGTADAPARILTVGALAEKKGHRYLIDALARVGEAAADATLDIVGGGELREELAAQAARLGLADRVRLRGEFSKEDVARVMRDSDLFVLPSEHETFGCVLIEALACGLPVVATRVGGVPEVVGDGEATLVEPRDPDALARAIESALGGANGEPSAQRAARTAERYGYAAFAAAWTDLYRELLARRVGRGEGRRGATPSG